MGHPYGGRNRSNLNLEVILEVKKPKSKITKNWKIVFVDFWQNCRSQGAQIWHRIFSHFVFLKIFAFGCLDNNRKMLTNITTTRRRTSRSIPRPARLRRRQKQRTRKFSKATREAEECACCGCVVTYLGNLNSWTIVSCVELLVLHILSEETPIDE